MSNSVLSSTTPGDTEHEARLAEQEAFDPPEAFVEQANVTDEGIYDEFEENWPDCWDRVGCLLDWDSKYERVLRHAPEPRNRRRDSEESPTVTGQSSSSR
ncbi:acyl-CoA synthetase I [Halogranum salarium B-1]|uniref:Acyl-CoA synthetase I n=1 Tax=Halogranum salarium B-1 TaxID=1210908 RepID=J3JGY9_9EURY|nr:acyl-CoA synthetase I [Halogranum salarium B-1]